MLSIEIIFWACIAILIYTYFGYILLIYLISRFLPKIVVKDDHLPLVSIIISAYNEEKGIEKKLSETLQLDYPIEKMEVIVASDGSTDRTEEIASRFSSPPVRLCRSNERKGKTNVQNIASAQAKGEIIVFTDATTELEKGSLKKIVRNFADPSVGCVAGKLIFGDLVKGSTGEQRHEKNIVMAYEQKVRDLESIARTTFGVDGCFYAVRKNLYMTMPLDVASDFALPLEIVSKGYRVIFEREARCCEQPPPSRAYEFNRKIRTASRGIYSLMKMKKLLNPLRYGMTSLMLLSHKVLRWLSIYFLIILFFSNIFLSKSSLFYGVIFFLQILFYVLVLIGFLGGDRIKPKILRIPFSFFMLNLTSFFGLVNVLRGKMSVTWETLR